MTTTIVKKTPVMETRAYPPEMERRNTYLAELDEILATAKKSNRNLTENENAKFNRLAKDIRMIDEEIKKNNSTGQTIKAKSPHEDEEVRSFINFIATGEHRDLSSSGSERDRT